MAKNEIRINPIGRIVMVHPLLTTDPAFMQGEIGKVVSVLDSVVTVNFDIDFNSRYQEDALVTLNSKKAILKQLQHHAENIPPFQQKMILKVVRLMMEKEPERALQYAMESDITAKHCTITLSEWIEQRELQKARNQGRSIN